jgi:very-short-patch-repair endonuclease
MSETLGDFVLTKSCTGPNCGCIGCALFSARIFSGARESAILDVGAAHALSGNLVAYPFTEAGELFLLSLKREKYKAYRGSVTKAELDKHFRVPPALVIIKAEEDGTFTHSYLSPDVEKRVISRGCRAMPHCPCVGCRIVDMWYTKGAGHLAPAVDISARRATPEGDLLLPIFEGHEIISAMLLRDPHIRHQFSPNIFDSPLEQMFYELAFLDLHIYPQHPVGKYRLDFAIPDKHIAIELDGHEYHKTKFQRTRDAQRDRWLFGQGWHVLRFTGTEIHGNLDRCIDEICELAGIERLSKPQRK